MQLAADNSERRRSLHPRSISMSAADAARSGATADDDQERGAAAPNPTTGDDQKVAPEHELNIVVIGMVFTRRVADFLGKLALLWATVVLLGGFASALSTKNFTFVTVITLVAATGLFSSAEDPRSRFLFSGLQSLYIPFMDWAVGLFPSTSTLIGSVVLLLILIVTLLPLALVIALVILFMALLPIAGAVACIVLSALQLATQGYSPDELSARAAIHLRTALNIFYVIALIQGAFFCISYILTIGAHVRKYSILGPNVDSDVVNNYFEHINKKSIDGDVFEIENTTLLRFAVEMLESSFKEKQRSGIKVVHRLIMQENGLTDVVEEIQLLPTAMTGIVRLARSDKDEDQEFKESIDKLKAALPKKMQDDFD